MNIFFPFFGRLGFYFFDCEPNIQIYRYSLLLKISDLPSYDLDKHKPITNLKRKRKKKIFVISTCFKSIPFLKCLFIRFTCQENRLKETHRALLLFVYGYMLQSCNLVRSQSQAMVNGVLKEKSYVCVLDKRLVLKTEEC